MWLDAGRIGFPDESPMDRGRLGFRLGLNVLRKWCSGRVRSGGVFFESEKGECILFCWTFRELIRFWGATVSA
jgi:hypothetical protein